MSRHWRVLLLFLPTAAAAQQPGSAALHPDKGDTRTEYSTPYRMMSVSD